MELVTGLLLLLAGVVGLKLACPRSGKPRSFVGTNLEIPVTLMILSAFAVGVVLVIGGIAAFRS
jgi:hypothetical protein